MTTTPNHTWLLTEGTLTPGTRCMGVATGPDYSTPWDGYYVGEEASEHDGEPMHMFRDGHINGIPQAHMGKPVAQFVSSDDVAHLSPVIDRVEVSKDAEGFFHVWPFWTVKDADPLQDPQGTGYSVRTKREAERLSAAIEAGVVFTDAKVRRNVYGETYVSARSHVMGKYLNADLRKLGY